MSGTGWPAKLFLAQDLERGLFEWFASKPDARRLVRESVERIRVNTYSNRSLRQQHSLLSSTK